MVKSVQRGCHWHLLHLNVLYEQLNYLKISFFINVPLLIGNRRRGRIKPKIGKEDKIWGGGQENVC